ncbi:MAG: GNAT family N-acetyltransferase [Dehalococcoidales bacterium]|nr:GNAT family N-acetyltransferase [Dehalococcoidales bacterium]
MTSQDMQTLSEEKLRKDLQDLSQVAEVCTIDIRNKFFKQMTIDTKLSGRLIIRRLELKDTPALFDFYYNKLSTVSRRFFPPYPLFSPPVKSPEELNQRIRDWQKEDDWIVLVVLHQNIVIGMGLLKRYHTDRPTTGLAVAEDYHAKGIGAIIQTSINEQARLLGLPRIYATLAPDNVASHKLHLSCGFVETGKLIPHYIYQNGIKVVDRQDLEMVNILCSE